MNPSFMPIFPLRRQSGYNASMTVLLSTLAVAFAAFCTWLGVRIVNRRETWAKWTLATVVALPVLYFASVGPACWMADWNNMPRETVLAAFRPIARIGFSTGGIPFERALTWYGKLFSPPDRYDSPMPLAYRYWEEPIVERLASEARPNPAREELKRRSSRSRQRR